MNVSVEAVLLEASFMPGWDGGEKTCSSRLEQHNASGTQNTKRAGIRVLETQPEVDANS